MVPILTLRYFNMKHGGFTPRARAEWVRRNPEAKRQVALADAAWARKYGTKTGD